MQKIRGRYINLSESGARRAKIEKQLHDLQLENNYERFDAIRGEAQEAKERGLKAGELGLWKSWLGILKEEKNRKEEQSRFLHIIEDDCKLTNYLYKLIKADDNLEERFDILATDMYVNPSIYETLINTCKDCIDNKTINYVNNIYTGCTSSMLIHQTKIEKVYSILENEYIKKERLIPLDNYLRRCNKNNELKIVATLPFLTSIQLEELEDSTIQSYNDQHKAIILTQKLCGLLRQELCITENKKSLKVFIEIYKKLKAEIRNEHDKRKEDEIFISLILERMAKEELLRYRIYPGLIQESDNPQRRIYNSM